MPIDWLLIKNQIAFMSGRRDEIGGNPEYVYNLIKDRKDIEFKFGKLISETKDFVKVHRTPYDILKNNVLAWLPEVTVALPIALHVPVTVELGTVTAATEPPADKTDWYPLCFNELPEYKLSAIIDWPTVVHNSKE